MNNYTAPLADLIFLLEDVFELEQFWRSLNSPGGIDKDLALAILKEAANFAEKELGTINHRADQTGARLENGEVRVPEEFIRAYQRYSEAGWNALGGNSEYGGMSLPKTLTAMVSECVQGACMSFSLAPVATASAASLINTYANEEIKSRYLPCLYRGECTGSMALTEAQAGSDLGQINTKAIKNEDGSFCIHGEKLFITWGEHNLSENIVHLVLARSTDSPKGVKGLSLFLVPKLLPRCDGEPAQKNKVSCTSLERKMGLHASPTCVLHFEGARAWLIGQKNSGLQCMFGMMNSMRLHVGINAVGVAESSFQNALEYAKERIQGKNEAGPVAIYDHADVRRMLSQMRANNEAGRALYLYVAMHLDNESGSEDEGKAISSKLVSFLTPIAKAFLTETAFDSAVMGQQILGGYGYTEDYILEQFVRDLRVTQIYEGTNGIQAIDLVKRKTIKCGGEYFEIFSQEIKRFITLHPDEKMEEFYTGLNSALEKVACVTKDIVSEKYHSEQLDFYAKDYLLLCGYLVFSYLWARMAFASLGKNTELAVEKMQTARFYFDYMLPQLDTHYSRLIKKSGLA